MAVPHYAYLKLKMPGNNGTPITVHGSFARSDTCDREFQKIASKFGAKEELNAIDATTDHRQPPADNRNACLGEQIGRNIEVYIDNIVVKTKHVATLIDDLRETFDNLDKYKIKLNPKKCFFGVPGGQVLGYFISARGIEANPLKIKAILDMEPPKNLHQVQQLAGRLAALSRFIAKLGEKALPFYNLMKKSEKFEWTKEAQESFDNLKKILSTFPVLVTPLLLFIPSPVLPKALLRLMSSSSSSSTSCPSYVSSPIRSQHQSGVRRVTSPCLNSWDKEDHGFLLGLRDDKSRLVGRGLPLPRPMRSGGGKPTTTAFWDGVTSSEEVKEEEEGGGGRQLLHEPPAKRHCPRPGHLPTSTPKTTMPTRRSEDNEGPGGGRTAAMTSRPGAAPTTSTTATTTRAGMAPR
ncbi:hypothetical protein QYE76_055685 [Lolium multiflorum]|uniref:Uncharacterized protein n=1 Tax=Lolium multiflorum TaxID=4521 RepID=A0AAD8WMI6_LOLMU|nr:hypothetical protein QYE76_055685 [Lolium multiflorum]